MPASVSLPPGSSPNDDASMSTLRDARGSLGKKARARYWPFTLTGRTSKTTLVLLGVHVEFCEGTYTKATSATCDQAPMAVWIAFTTLAWRLPKVVLTQ